MARAARRKRTDAKPKLKTAVVVVHGMGEQRPMETLWGLVEALWIQDPDHCTDEFEVYSKPDRIADSYELRRITTRYSLKSPKKRADFFELYWAHRMQGNTVAAVFQAAKALLWRSPDNVPQRLMGVWVVGWIVLALAVVLSMALPLGLEKLLGLFGYELRDGVWATAAVALFALFNLGFGGLLKNWVGPVAGDAARYLSPHPDNIAAREAIRKQAVQLIEALHRTNAYDRIVVVGHSLGTVVAYDALSFAFGQIPHPDLKRAHEDPATAAALDRLEDLTRRISAAKPDKAPVLRVEYRDAQRDYLRLLAKARRRDGRTPLWLVSDFVTTASPLSKADVLIARNEERFRRRIKRRDVAVSPPFLEKSQWRNGLPRFSYPERRPRGPHHAAVFAPTVWTNLYFATEQIVLGDVIAGPVAPLFGPAVLDVRLDRDRKAFRHLDYWAPGQGGRLAPAWIRALRKAVNLRELDEAALWGEQAAALEVDANGV